MGIAEDRKIPMRRLDTYIAQLKRRLLAAPEGRARDRIRTRLRRAYLGRSLKRRTAARVRARS
jgi:hypothetical protein